MAQAYRHTEQVLQSNLDKLQAVRPAAPSSCHSWHPLKHIRKTFHLPFQSGQPPSSPCSKELFSSVFPHANTVSGTGSGNRPPPQQSCDREGSRGACAGSWAVPSRWAEDSVVGRQPVMQPGSSSPHSKHSCPGSAYSHCLSVLAGKCPAGEGSHQL